jgi:hypothetical protein
MNQENKEKAKRQYICPNSLAVVHHTTEIKIGEIY